MFEPYEVHDVGANPQSVAIADVTGDGLADAVMTTSSGPDPDARDRLFVFPQRSDGRLGPPLRLPTRGGPNMGVAAGDLDCDGRVDVAVATASGIEVFMQRRDGLGPGRLVAEPALGTYLEIADMDDDGRNDILVLGDGRLRLLTNAGDRFVVSTIGETPTDRGFAVGDVDGDGRLDVAHVRWSGPWDLTIFSRKGGRGAWDARVVTLDGEKSSSGVDIGDVTGDGRADVVVTDALNRPRSRIRVLAQAAEGGLGAPVDLESYDIPEPVRIHDLDGDGRRDVVVLHAGWGQAGIYLQDRRGRLGRETLIPMPYTSHYASNGLAVGDIDSDGRPDLVIADYSEGLVVIRQAHRRSAPPRPAAGASVQAPAPRADAPPVPEVPRPPAPAPARVEGASEAAPAPSLAVRSARLAVRRSGAMLEVRWAGGAGPIRWTLDLAARRADGRILRDRVRGAGAPGVRTVRRALRLGPAWRGARARARLTLTDGESTIVRVVRRSAGRTR
jgi:hypothetical protein